MKQHKNLLFLKILNAGHMVPMDQPQISLRMISTFIYNESFDDSKQQLPLSLTNRDDSACDCQQQQSSKDLPLSQPYDVGKGDLNSPMVSNKAASASNSVILFAWIAALFAVTALFFYALMKRRRKNRFVLASAIDEDETELHHTNSIEVM
jgi:hypothetical protein